MGTSTVPDRATEVLHPDKSGGPSTAADKNGLNSGSAAAKILCSVRDSGNAFGSLRSVAGALCSILENCDVCHPSCMHTPQHLHSFQQAEVDVSAIELLAPRIRVLSKSLCAPIKLGDFNERVRGKKLEQ